MRSSTKKPSPTTTDHYDAGVSDIHDLMKRAEAAVSKGLADAESSNNFDPAKISDQAKTGVGQVLTSLENYLDTIPDRETAIKVGNEIAGFLGGVVFEEELFSDLEGAAGPWIESDDDDEEDGIASDYDGDLPA